MNGSNSSSWSSHDGGRYRHQWPDGRRNNNSTISKMQHQYWVTKETVFRKLGKKEDAYIVASDAELDAKLELFRSIQDSCLDLQRIIDKYQERICLLAQEENSMGRFLKECGKQDKTGAGNMMLGVGRTMSHSGQQRLALRMPLLRLFQEVETFRHRAIEDTWKTVQAMEKSRTEYRASLSWMKDISQELDPDTYKQLEKFRKVQDHVKMTKARFDRYKLDCLQKIDLLAAARCNMFSHALITYHNTMLQFATASAQAFTTVGDSFKDYQRFEFNHVKELSEIKPEENSTNDQEQDDKLLDFDDFETENKEEEKNNEEGGGDSGGGVDLLIEEAVAQPQQEQQLQLEQQNQQQQFMPSQLLMQPAVPSNNQALDQKTQMSTAQNNMSSGAKSTSKSSWLELFSELDPLANPDSIGQTSSAEPLRNC